MKVTSPKVRGLRKCYTFKFLSVNPQPTVDQILLFYVWSISDRKVYWSSNIFHSVPWSQFNLHNKNVKLLKNIKSASKHLTDFLPFYKVTSTGDIPTPFSCIVLQNGISVAPSFESTSNHKQNKLCFSLECII